jgi:hypothetical protein
MTQSIGTISTSGAASFSFSVPSSGAYYIGFHHDGDSWSYMDDVQLTATSGLIFHDLQIASGIATFTQDMKIANDLQTSSGATADFAGHAITVDGTVTNDGGIKQTRTVSNGVMTEFGRLQSADGTSDKYFGMEITPSSGDMGATTVEIRGNQGCDASTTATNGVQRCYIITPTTSQSGDLRFYYRSSESNGNSSPDIYLDSGSAWTLQTTSAHGGSNDGIWAEGAGLSANGTFLLAGAVTSHTVTPDAGTGGSLSPATPQTVTHGSSTSFTVSLAEGYAIDSVSG